MNIRETVSKRQRAIIHALIQCEESIAGLYEIYAGKNYSDTGLWQRLAVEEHSHAAMLNTLLGYLDQGHLFTSLDNFGVENVSVITQWAAAAVAEAQGDVPESVALQNAIKIESSLVDSEFYNEVKSEAPEFKYIAETLRQATRKHIKSIQDRFKESLRA